MGQDWIDFKKLRQSLDFTAVLRFYGVEVKGRGRDGQQHQGLCPLPTHRSRSDRGGGKPSASFSANLEKGVFQCFSCHASGNVLDFVCIMEGMNPADSAGIRRAAVIAQEKFLGHESREPPAPRRGNTDSAKAGTATAVTADRSKTPVLVNPPLDFELKGLDPDHRYPKDRGFNEATIRHFGLGFCSRGLLSGRIAIPLRDHGGRLIGYAGRIVDEHRIDEENPKYLFPGTRERNGQVLEFRKTLFLYNGHSIKKPVEDLIVVEGFPSVWWLWQWGYTNVVGLMGSSCSPEQASLIVSLTDARDGCVWAFTDADAGGEEFAASVLPRVALHRLCRRVQAKSGQPTDCTPADLAQLLWGECPVPSSHGGSSDESDHRSNETARTYQRPEAQRQAGDPAATHEGLGQARSQGQRPFGQRQDSRHSSTRI